MAREAATPTVIVTGNARRRIQRPKVKIDLPVLPAHHHVGTCTCAPCVAYIRVSSLGGRDKIVSPQIQLDEIVADSIKNNRQIIKLYFDLRSGTSTKGRKLDQILEEITSGEYRTVAVWKWNRWGRNNLQSLQMCNLVDEVGGAVVSATEAFETKTPTGEFIRDMLLAQAAWQSRLIGEGWRSAQRLRREADLPHSGRERFGYVYANKEFIVDPEESEYLLDAYERITSRSVSLGKLVVEWNAKGLVTTLGGPWTESGLGQMLDTGFAAGWIRERSKPKAKRTRNALQDYDVWRKGSHDAIIDEELWQRYRAAREAATVNSARLHVPVYEFSRLLFCGICTRRLCTHRNGNSATHNWRCPARAGMHPEQANGISNTYIREAVHSWIAHFVAENDRSAEVTLAAQKRVSRTPKPISDADRLMDALAKVKQKKDRLLKLYIAGINPDLDEARYKRELDPLTAEEQAIRAELGRVEMTAAAPDPALLLPAFRALSDLWGDPAVLPAERNYMISQLVGMVVVAPRTSTRRSESRGRLTIVPVWEMDAWSEWFAAKRRKNAAA